MFATCFHLSAARATERPESGGSALVAVYEVVQFERIDLATIESLGTVAQVIEQSAQFLPVSSSNDRAISGQILGGSASTMRTARRSAAPTVMVEAASCQSIGPSRAGAATHSSWRQVTGRNRVVPLDPTASSTVWGMELATGPNGLAGTWESAMGGA